VREHLEGSYQRVEVPVVIEEMRATILGSLFLRGGVSLSVAVRDVNPLGGRRSVAQRGLVLSQLHSPTSLSVDFLRLWESEPLGYIEEDPETDGLRVLLTLSAEQLVERD
jgi:hypothetical protein